MFTNLVAVSVVICAVLAAPQDQFSPQHGHSQQTSQQTQSQGGAPVQIISQSEVNNADGSFNYSYETANGIKVQESGYLKPGNPQLRSGPGEEGVTDNGDILVAVGSYSYTAPDGTVINLSYTADDNGFQPQGDHIPTLAPAIQRALGVSASSDQQRGQGSAQFSQPPTGFGNSQFSQTQQQENQFSQQPSQQGNAF